MAPPTNGNLVVIDADGDLILKVGKVNNDGEDVPTGGQDSGNQVDSAQMEGLRFDSPELLLIRVSSKFLIMCSPVFKVMLNGPFGEGQLSLSSTNPPTLELPEDDPSAMLVLYQVLHFKQEAQEEDRFRDISKVAIVSDKYQCARVTKPWFYYHLYKHRSSHKRLSGSSLALVLNASYLLRDEDAFHQLTVFAARYLPREVENSSFGMKLLPCLQEKLIPCLRTLHENHFGEFNNLVQRWVSLILRNTHDEGGKWKYKDADGMEISIEKPCPRSAGRGSYLISRLDSLHLWSGNFWPYKSPGYSVDEAWKTLKWLGTTVLDPDSMFGYDSDPDCDCCITRFEDEMYEIGGTEMAVRGVCLICLKQEAEVDVKFACDHQGMDKCTKYSEMACQLGYGGMD